MLARGVAEGQALGIGDRLSRIRLRGVATGSLSEDCHVAS